MNHTLIKAGFTHAPGEQFQYFRIDESEEMEIFISVTTPPGSLFPEYGVKVIRNKVTSFTYFPDWGAFERSQMGRAILK